MQIPAITSNKTSITLSYTPGALILNSSFDLILGMPFIRHWKLQQHFCNNSLCTIKQQKQFLTIPLNNTSNTPCQTHCPFAVFQRSLLPSTIQTKPLPPPPYTSYNYTPPIAHTTTLIPSSSFTSIPQPKQNQTDPTASPTLVSQSIEWTTPQKFARYAAKSNTLSYLCIIQTSTTSPHSNDKVTTQFEEYALQQFPTLFPEQLPHELPPANRLQHPIDLKPDAKPPARRLYRQTDAELQETKKQIQEYLEAGHIRPSTSVFGAPILLVKKKDGSMRMCIDYHALNDITLKNTFPLPRIDDLHDRLGKAHYFTKLDLYSGYHQIPIRPGDEYKTAFTSRYSTFEFLVMPFGLTNAPSTFQTAMNTLFYDWLDDFVIVYLDDILIYSPDLETHKKHLHLVLKRLHKHKWYCKLKKCSFAQTSVEYLGHIISHGTITIDPTKMQAVTDWQTPFKNLTEVQSFLGLIRYYRKFIPHFSYYA